MDTDKLRQNWLKFIQDGVVDESVPPVVAKSWRKCRNYGVDPMDGAAKHVDRNVMKSIVSQNRELLEIAEPIMNSIYEIVKRSEFRMVLTDSVGYILAAIGRPPFRPVINGNELDLHFEVGALWSTTEVGSNAVGIALDNDMVAQLVGPEHYCISHHDFACSAAPIHGIGGELIGCLCLSSVSQIAHPHTLGIVQAAAFGIETQLLSLHSSCLMQAALNAGSDSMLILDEYLHPIWMNQAAEKLMNLSPDQLLKQNVREMLPDLNWDDIINWRRERNHSSDGIPLVVRGKTSYCNVAVSPILNQNKKGFTVTLTRQDHVIRQLNRISGNRASYTFEDILAADAVMKRTVALAQKYALYDGSVLIEGESGTGKELFAQAIHNHSSRSSGPFVAINCATLPRDLVESELFGYEKGAFTGAIREGNPGKFEMANHGTIFLDEIGEMPLEFQAKLLRVVETHRVRRLGGTFEKELDVRIIVATNRKLKQEVEQGRFRDDLYFRLNVMKLDIPPLRERPEDIGYCARHFLEHFNRRYPELSKRFDDTFLQALCNYYWPGNVRELQNGIERAFYTCSSDLLTHLDVHHITGKSGGLSLHSNVIDLKSPGQEGDRDRISGLLAQCRGNVEEAAAAMGISRASMYRRINECGLNPKDYRKNA